MHPKLTGILFFPRNYQFSETLFPNSVRRWLHTIAVEHTRFLFTNSAFPVGSFVLQIPIIASEQDTEFQTLYYSLCLQFINSFSNKWCPKPCHTTYANTAFSFEPNAIARFRGPQSLNKEQETSAFSNLLSCPAIDKVHAGLWTVQNPKEGCNLCKHFRDYCTHSGLGTSENKEKQHPSLGQMIWIDR